MYDTKNLCITLTDEKRNNIMKLVKTFQRKLIVKIRDWAKFIGILEAACPAIKYARLYKKFRNFEIFIATKI